MTLTTLELIGVVTVILLIAGTCTKLFLNKLGDFREILDRDIKAVGSASDRDAREFRHDLKNERSRIDALQQLDLDKEKRVLKLESAVSNIEKSQDRIEKLVEKGFGDLATSIREIRTVGPKP